MVQRAKFRNAGRSFEHFVSAGDGPGMGRRSFSLRLRSVRVDDDDGLVQ